MEIWKDPSVLIVYLIVILLFIIVFTFLFFLLHQKSLKKILDTELKRSKAEVLHQKNIVKISVDVQEEERKRIARIIHDDIGNRVHILSVWLNNPEAWQSERAKEIILKQLPALSEATRTVSHALYPVDVEHIGFIATLEEMAVNASASLNIQLVLLHLYQAPSLAVEIQLYRIIQEFLNNVLKHAQASQMYIHLRSTEHYCAVLLADNGKGFNLTEVKKGMGLHNIEARIQVIQAAFKWKSTEGKGTQLLILISKQ